MENEVRIRVMTVNLRFDNPEDGPFQWRFRKERVFDIIRSERPGLLATQEGMNHQLEDLARNLPGYKACLKNRLHDPHPKIQRPTIFYDRNRFLLKDGGEFWLSETPDLHLSKSWGSAFPRLFTYAYLEHRRTSGTFWFCCTHFDHVSEPARINSARIVRDWVKRKRKPVILAGDFNDVPDSEVYRILTENPTGLNDTWRLKKKCEGDDFSTFHGFTGRPFGGRIDWILTAQGIRCIDARILTAETVKGDVYPTDHYPYLADVFFL